MRYGRENDTVCRRSQLTVNASATRSTASLVTNGVRCPVTMARVSNWSGRIPGPKIAFATARAISTSRPSISWDSEL